MKIENNFEKTEDIATSWVSMIFLQRLQTDGCSFINYGDHFLFLNDEQHDKIIRVKRKGQAGNSGGFHRKGVDRGGNFRNEDQPQRPLLPCAHRKG